jgi:hypothetical protein
MITSEKDALVKLCVVRLAVSVPLSQGGERCKGSACMAWRCVSPHNDDGYCGIAGSPPSVIQEATSRAMSNALFSVTGRGEG